MKQQPEVAATSEALPGEEEQLDDSLADSDIDAGAVTEQQTKSLIRLHPISPNASESRCAVCSRLNPTVDGLVQKKGSYKALDESGKPTGKWIKGWIRIRAETPKDCAPDRNPNCPAREVKFVVGGNIEALAQQYVNALRNNSFARIGEISQEVMLMDEELQAQFTAHVQALQRGAEHG